MSTNIDLISILDSDPACVALYHQTLGLQYKVTAFSSISEFASAYDTFHCEPKLVIADPDNVKGSFADFFNDQTSGQKRKLPNVLIATKLDDLELMRFFFRTGARDYILKPLRANELVARVERALHQISNREIMILRNDLDGKQVHDLTFREHQILTVLLSRPNRSSPRDELHEAVWNKVAVNRKTLDVHLFNLRRKLRPLGYDIICHEQMFTLTRTNLP